MRIRSWVTIFGGVAGGIFIARNYHYSILLLTALMLIILGIIIKASSSKILFLIVMILGAGYYWFRIPQVPNNLPNVASMKLEGKVIAVDIKDNKTSLVLRTDQKSRYMQKVQVYSYSKLDIKKGDRVKLQGQLTVPNLPGNPGVFNYRRYLADQNIFYQMVVNKNNPIQIVEPAPQQSLSMPFLRARAENIIRDILPFHEADILLGMLLGEKESLDEEVYLQFQKTGIVHLLAVSGLHIGFLLLLCSWLADLFRLMPTTKFYCNSGLIFFYGALIGWPVSVRRAVIMAFLALLALQSGHERKLPDTLGLAGVIILLINPADLFRISFQLSFLATWGLVYIYPALREKISHKSQVIDFLLVPFCAQIATMPLTAYYFNLFSPVALLANVIVTYLAGAVVLLGFLALFFCLLNIQFIAGLILPPVGLLIEFILAVNEKLALIPGASIWVATPGLLSIGLYYGALLIIILTVKGRLAKKTGLMAAAFMPCFLIYLLLPAGFWSSQDLECTFLDVGQGDCIIIKTPQGKYMLIDGGGSEVSDVGTSRVLPYLHHRGIRKIEWLVNTHPDTDHLQGVERVAEELKVKHILIPASLIDCEDYLHLKRVAAARKINLQGLSTKQEWHLDKDIKVTVLHPDVNLSGVSDFNSHSLVLQLVYKKFSGLFTGDIGTATMQALPIDNNFNCSVVKVPHHGSRTSNCAEFYEKIQPLYAVIQAGKNNRFGHPHPEIVEILARQKITILRNDLHGAVFIRSNGHNLQVKTHKDAPVVYF